MNNNKEYVNNNSDKRDYEKNNNSHIIFYSFIIVIISIILYFILFNIKKPIKLNIIEQNYYYTDANVSLVDIIKNSKENDEYIIGIDFGAINSGYSYVLKKDISDIISKKKSSTEIELSRETKKGLKFSLVSSVSLMNYRNDELNKINFIKGFKYLFEPDYIKNKENNLCFMYPSNFNNDKANIIHQFFLMLKNNIKEEIKNNKIKWILSIPSTWNQFEKQIIRNATIESGMYNIEYIHESDAAALSFYFDKYIPDKYKKKNNVFMIVDAGGYSIDITIYQIIDKDGTMKQIISTESYNLGILNITYKIIKIIEDIFGKAKIDNVRNKEPGEWVKTLNDINNAIENTNYIDGSEVFEITGRFGNKNNYYDYENNKKYKITYNKFNVNFPGALIGKLIFENVNIIKTKMEEIIQNIKLKQIKLNNIIITGGFSQNKIFQNEIETKFKDVNYLSSYYRVISKGAVLYGIHPNMIRSRISPVTIGVGYSNNEKNEILLLVRKGEEFKKHSLLKIIKLYKKEVDYINLNIFISNDYFINFEELSKNKAGKIVLILDKDNKSDIQLRINYETIISFSCNYENGKDIDANMEFYN